MKYKIKLSTVTTYKFGGYCNNFYKISNNDINLFEEAFSNKENFILGKGSNVAFSDKDYEGNVINPNFNEISYIKNLGEGSYIIEIQLHNNIKRFKIITI